MIKKEKSESSSPSMGKLHGVNGRKLGFYLVMVLPAFLVYIFIVAYPVIYSFILSLSEQSAGVYNFDTGKIDVERTLVGFKHYVYMFKDPDFWFAFTNNMIVVVVSLLGQIPIGFILAYLLYRNYVKARGFFQAMVFLPNFISTVVVGIVWSRLIYSPYGPLVAAMRNSPFFISVLVTIVLCVVVLGLINYWFSYVDKSVLVIIGFTVFTIIILAIIGVLHNFVFLPLFSKLFPANPNYIFTMGEKPYMAMIPIGVALIWMYTGFYMIIFLANLQKVNSEVLEAASIDGATESQVFLRLAVPMLSGTILINAILAISGSLKGFDLIFSMTGGGPGGMTKVLPIYMFEIFKNAPEVVKYTRGAAASSIIIFISFALILVARSISKRLEKV